MPAKLSVRERARVTAGFANEVDDVNQYAAVMYPPTASAIDPTSARPALLRTIASSPKLATNSARS